MLDHCQQVLGGLDVLVAPASPTQFTAAVRLLDERREWAELKNGEPPILADCGRLVDEPTTAHLLHASALVVVLARPILSELHHVASRLSALRAVGGRVAVVLAGHGPYSASEVADTLNVEVLGSLPNDPESAAILAGAPGSRRALARLPLLRSAADLLERVQVDAQTEARPAPAGSAAALDPALAECAT